MSRSSDPRLPGFDRATSVRLAPEAADKARGNRAGGPIWRCFTCGEMFKYQTGKAGFETHADTARHYRIEVVFE